MKRSCKHIDITNWKTAVPWVTDCLERHYKRYDFKWLLLSAGRMTQQEYAALLNGDKRPLWESADYIAKKAVQQIKERQLELAPCRIEEKKDKSTYKTRLIGKEGAMQQVMDYIAIQSCGEIWKRRIVAQQTSSFKNRGQTYGTSMISRWMKDDIRAIKWAETHEKRYTPKCKYFVKLDIKKCFPSLRIEPFMEKFRRDCANEDILWLWKELLKSHRVKITGTDKMYEGFMIDALPSQWACQYLLSFAYRFVMGLHSTRRGKVRKKVSHALFFMDDILLCGSSRKNLKSAVRELAAYLMDEFGLEVKTGWQICETANTPIDMMGFRIHADGNVTIRPRVFIRARRIALRIMRSGYPCIRRAERILSYKGFFAQNAGKIRNAIWRKRRHEKCKFKILRLRTVRMRKKLSMRWIFKYARHVIRIERRKQNDCLLQQTTRGDTVYVPA